MHTGMHPLSLIVISNDSTQTKSVSTHTKILFTHPPHNATGMEIFITKYLLTVAKNYENFTVKHVEKIIIFHNISQFIFLKEINAQIFADYFVSYFVTPPYHVKESLPQASWAFQEASTT